MNASVNNKQLLQISHSFINVENIMDYFRFLIKLRLKSDPSSLLESGVPEMTRMDFVDAVKKMQERNELLT